MNQLITTLVLVVSTNWTTFSTGFLNTNGAAPQQLGYVVTNHVLRVEYGGLTQEVTLLVEPSNKAVWRPEQSSIFYGTNVVVEDWSTSKWFDGAVLRLLVRSNVVSEGKPQ